MKTRQHTFELLDPHKSGWVDFQDVQEAMRNLPVAEEDSVAHEKSDFYNRTTTPPHSLSSYGTRTSGAEGENLEDKLAEASTLPATPIPSEVSTPSPGDDYGRANPSNTVACKHNAASVPGAWARGGKGLPHEIWKLFYEIIGFLTYRFSHFPIFVRNFSVGAFSCLFVCFGATSLAD